MAVSTELSTLIKQIPGNDGDWFKGLKWEDAAKICDGILSNTPQNVAGLVAALNEVDNGKDFQPRYLLHILSVYVGRPEKAAAKAAVVDALAGELAANHPSSIYGTIIRELQFLCDKKAAKAIAPFLTDDTLYPDAANALLTIREGSTELLLAALPKANARCRAMIVETLGTLGDPAALPALKAAAAEKEEDTRLAALWGLARMGDAGSIDLFLEASDAPAGWARIQAAEACMSLASKLVAAGKKTEATKIYGHLKETRAPNETYLRDAAARAMANAT